MIILFDKKFDKKFTKLSQKIQGKFYERLEIFKINQFDRLLNNHKLSGKYEGCNSINITGDYRAVFSVLNETSEEIYIFIAIGTHPEWYE
ncbi:MAG: type II toxin-antitoxin system mRNA interferase toxin, RelE/StbE family [Patescibacteria group bacterium]